MKVWGKKREEEWSCMGVARAALAGASRDELLQETLQVLAQERSADRIGVWIDADANAGGQGEIPALFRGLVWDRENPGNPRGWMDLLVGPPLPDELLLDGKTVEEDLLAFPERPIIGQLLGLRCAMWIPVASKHCLRGVILAGSKGKQLALSRDRAESLAAELALALELREQERILRLRNEDLAMARRFLETQAARHSVNTLLSNLVASCTESAGNANGPGAAFAVIGELSNSHGASSRTAQVEFHWRSGDEAWTHAIESEPLASMWRRALQARQVMGGEPHVGWAQKSVGRIVAFPLEADGQLLGTMVAGTSSGAESVVTLDRLELRAALAASALMQRRKNAEEERQASGRQALLDLVSEPLLLVDEAGRIMALSRGAQELAGRSQETAALRINTRAAPEHFSQLFRGRDREHIQSWLRNSQHVEVMSPVHEEAGPQAELHNGTSVQLSLVLLAPGQPAAILLEPLRVRDSRLQEDHAETELQNVIEWLEEGVVLFDARDNVRAINTRFAQIVNLAPGESGEIKTLEGLIKRLAGQAAEPALFAEKWRALARGLEGGVREELQMARPVPRILERAARPVLDSMGRPLGRVEIYRDLTAQRVFHSKLLQTEKLAALGQMVSSIAHELSNPLTSILGYAQRLLVRQENDGPSEEARQIHQEAERASTILRQLLLNAREAVPERRLLSLNQIVMRTMELQGLGLATEKIRIEIDLDPTLPFIHGDPGHLQQVLMNLIGNARQALEHQAKGGTIRLRTRQTGERRVLLEVADNGPGIPQAILARIFDPFFTTKPVGVGTGLGLAIVLSAVREHGGQVHVLSPPQGGATFQIELPAAAEFLHANPAGPVLLEKIGPLAESAPLASLEDPGTTDFETGKGARVLVVEDEPTVAQLIADVLEDEGMLVNVLLDGRQALVRAARESYDLVICDMKMPGLDGQHFYKSLERTGNPLREHFLFVTGDVVAAQTREFLERNRLPHVAKPFRVEELTEKVHATLGIKFCRKSAAVDMNKKNATGKG